jgi:ferritin-like metal-binding protein YciE
MASIRTAREMLLHALADIYDAEHRFLEGHRQMRARVRDARLRDMLERHSGETEGHIRTLQQAFAKLGATPERDREPCRGAIGLVEEAATLMRESSAPVIDSLVACAASKVEQYEIVSYRDLIEAACAMGHRPVARLLERNLHEEERTAERLQQASSRLIEQAVRASE